MKKKDIVTKCRGILYKYNKGESVSGSDDVDFLLELFTKHPHWELKKGVGVKSIFVDLTQYKTKCFNIVRLDESKTDISYLQCISPSTEISDIKAACRSAIRGEIIRYRQANVIYGVTKCLFTGEVLTSDNCHIDHYDKTFNAVFSEWFFSQNQEQVSRGLNNTRADNETEIYFTDRDIIQSFVEYHNSNTHLRAISDTVNLTLPKI